MVYMPSIFIGFLVVVFLLGKRSFAHFLGVGVTSLSYVLKFIFALGFVVGKAHKWRDIPKMWAWIWFPHCPKPLVLGMSQH